MTSTLNSELNLAPCPFCGGEARIKSYTTNIEIVCDHQADCIVSGSSVEMSCYNHPGAIDEIVEEWNQLAAPQKWQSPAQTLRELQSNQWWLKEMAEITVLAEPTPGMVRAARTAINFANAVFARGPIEAQSPAAPNEPVQALPELLIKTWQERTDECTPTAVVMAMESEIADLRAAIASCRALPAKDEAREPPDYLKWWTGIETDVRKSMLVWAGREPERLHALVRQAFEAGAALAASSKGEGK